jgi:hypothetical protein
VIEKIPWPRKHYHFDPAKIAIYLARCHDVTISTSGVWRILKRLRNEPAARVAALPTAGAAVEGVREATARPSAEGGC